MKNGKLFCLLLALCLLTGCTAPQSTAQSSHKVSFIAKSTTTEFWRSAFAGAGAAATEYNVSLSICGPETEEDDEAQNEMIRNAVQDGAEAIVFSAISYEGNAAAIDEAAEAGVAIVVIDSDVDSSHIGVRIGTDNVDAGRQAAETALQTDEETISIGIVNYDPGSRNGQEREQGFRAVAENDPRVADIQTINVLTSAMDAMGRTKELLLAHPEINVLVAFNEPTSVGAAMAVEALSLSGKLRMVGFDSNVKTIDLMQTGDVSALIVQNPYAMGYLGVEAACGLLDDQRYDPTNLVDTGTTVVTKENMFSIESQKAMFAFN